MQKKKRNQPSVARVVLLTAQPDVLEEILLYLKDPLETVHPQGTIYQQGDFAGTNGNWKIAVAEISQGNNSAALETERIINHFSPDVAFFIGLAGGIKDVHLGDVVASTKLYNYEAGKEKAGSFEPRPSAGRSAYGLEQRAKNEARQNIWQQRLGEELQFPRPRAKIGPIAAGEKKIDSNLSATGQLLKRNYGDALAVEMEGSGFLEAVHANPRVDGIVIRGVSALLTSEGTDNTEESVRAAARNACAFAFEMLSKLTGFNTGHLLNSSAEDADEAKGRLFTEAHSSPPKSSNDQLVVSDSKSTDRLKVVSVENLYSILTGSPDAVFLLGGGTAVKSGIPLSEGIVEKAVKWEYCNYKGLNFDDPNVKRSDWLRLLRDQSWFKNESLSANYSFVMKHLLRPRDNRRRFFYQLLNTNVSASKGYERLVELMSLKLIMTVMTPNFDSVLRDLSHSRSRLHHVDIIDNPTEYKTLTTSPGFPRIVYLYGSLANYIEHFESDKEPQLDGKLISRLVPILRDHPLIVIGYHGAEEAIMRHLLMAQIEETDYYHQGVYWCALNYKDSTDLHPFVNEFASLIRGNFQVVPIEGFDELMEQISILHQKRQHVHFSVNTRSIEPIAPPPTFDMQTIEADTQSEFDWVTMQSRLVNYCDVMEIAVPATVTRDWVIEQLCQLDLAVRKEGGEILPTNAGYLLFARKSQKRIQSSRTLLRVTGEEQWIEGNLWDQLAILTDALAEFNKPFRLKGDKSETVYPYPPLALKEVLVNALVHRKYDVESNVIVEIENDCITVTNPGGLVEEVLRQTEGSSILSQIEQGKRGIKGYRNPVLADLFYGSGDMDKEGSGLADVFKLVTDNGGRVSFDPINQNTAFEVIIYSRPEAVDKQTRTAPRVVSTRYATNLLEVLEMPDKIWQAPTVCKTIKDVWVNTSSVWLPPFIPHNQKLHTFFSLEDPKNPLRALVDIEDIRKVSVKQFCEGDDAGEIGDERQLVWLLNECLYRHLSDCGLYVDKVRKRAYFPRTEEGNRSIHYQARLRRSSRTVTKQIFSLQTGKTRYWEHQSFSFMFERFGDAWVLQILPGYVFTRDGFRNLLSGERVNVLSTKRASRDYNNKVHTDLTFWAWVLSGGNQGSFVLQLKSEILSQKKLSELPKKLLKHVDKETGKYLYPSHMPLISISTALPTLTMYSLEMAEDEEESLIDKQQNAEYREIEEELGFLAELDDEFDDELED